MHQHATLEDTVYFWFGSNDTSGSGDDGASAASHVRLAGAAASAAPVLSPSPALLTHASYPAGCYEVAVAATSGNGFAAGNTYGVFCTLAVDSQNPTGFIGSFTLAPIPADMVQVSGDATAADNVEKDYDGTGYDKSNSTIGTCTTNTDMVSEPPTAVQNRQEMDSNSTQLAAIVADTGTDGVVVAAASKTGYRLSSTGVDDLLRTALTEGYAADGAAPTLEQFLFMLLSIVADFSIAGTTITCKELDGSTPSMTFTLDDATNPTSRTRAT